VKLLYWCIGVKEKKRIWMMRLSRELTRVAARVSIPHTSFCFKREATRVYLSSKLSREYEFEKSSVKRENANPSETRLGKD
jgi:hypothetical protein